MDLLIPTSERTDPINAVPYFEEVAVVLHLFVQLFLADGATVNTLQMQNTYKDTST